MKKGGDLINQRLRNLQTPAGQTNTTSTSTNSRPGQLETDERLIYAINTAFTELEAAMPFKFRSAYPTDDDRERAKAFWRVSLKRYSAKQIVLATRKAIQNTKFFPDLADVLKYCRPTLADYDLKTAQQAYVEACNASSQTRDYHWSNLVVYLAARATGWTTLRSEPQKVALPLFERNYDILCQRLLDGEDLEAEVALALDDKSQQQVLDDSEAYAKARQQEQMRKLKVNPAGGRNEFLKLRQQLKSK